MASIPESFPLSVSRLLHWLTISTPLWASLRPQAVLFPPICTIPHHSPLEDATMVDDDRPLYDPTDPALLALLGNLHRHTMHYGTTTAVCGVQGPAGQVTDISALVSCQQCLRLVPPPSRWHWAVAYGPKEEGTQR